MLDGQLRPIRRNDVAFKDEATGLMVSRTHAHIEFDGEACCFRLFDDGSANGTAVLRDGLLLPVPNGPSKGVALVANDEIIVGQFTSASSSWRPKLRLVDELAAFIALKESTLRGFNKAPPIRRFSAATRKSEACMRELAHGVLQCRTFRSLRPSFLFAEQTSFGGRPFRLVQLTVRSGKVEVRLPERWIKAYGRLKRMCSVRGLALV